MGSQGLEGCSTPIGAVSTMRGTEVMESLFSDDSKPRCKLSGLRRVLFPRSSGDFLGSQS